MTSAALGGRAQRKILLDLFSEQFECADIPRSSVAATMLLQVVDGMRTGCPLFGPDAVQVDAILDHLLLRS
ncbi:hypothetical protein ACFFWE_08305 [Sphaerisporangium melleum]|uniref:hypothetical protein n=1 Tax=Sphaerisporangium melleum TaxID=321316 RepID=UPI001669351B|nr:hypothetical protein [Sphaerisporangium melleum]